MAALTLLEASKLVSGEVIRSAIIEMFARNSDILETLPFININGNAYKYNREAALPGIAFRGVNEAYTASAGVINPITESLVIAGGDLDVDKFITTTEGEGVRTTHENLKVKALTAAITTNFLKGDNISDPRQFDGLQPRLTGTQLVVAGATANGTPLSLGKLDELIDSVSDPTHLIMNRTMSRRLAAAARTTTVGGFVSYDMNSFGQRVMSYNGLRILNGYDANLNTAILPFTEAASSGTATATSIYCVSFGPAGVVGLQSSSPDVRDLGEIPEKPVMRTRVEWYMAIAVLNGRAAARLWSVSDAAITA